jgi:hypothetical protein
MPAAEGPDCDLLDEIVEVDLRRSSELAAEANLLSKVGAFETAARRRTVLLGR